MNEQELHRIRQARMAQSAEGTMHCSECGVELEPHEIDGVCEDCENEVVLENVVVGDARKAAVLAVMVPGLMASWALYTAVAVAWMPEAWPYAEALWMLGAFSCIGSPGLIFASLGNFGLVRNAAGAAHRLEGRKEYEGLARIAKGASTVGFVLSMMSVVGWILVPLVFFWFRAGI